MRRMMLVAMLLTACGDPVSPVEDVLVGTYDLTMVTTWGSGATGELPFPIFFDVYVDSATLTINADNTGSVEKYMRKTSHVENSWTELDRFVWTRQGGHVRVNDAALAQSKGIAVSRCDFTLSLSGPTLVIGRRNEDLHYPQCGEHERLQEERYERR
jgi:hypothetical protein